MKKMIMVLLSLMVSMMLLGLQHDFNNGKSNLTPGSAYRNARFIPPAQRTIGWRLNEQLQVGFDGDTLMASHKYDYYYGNTTTSQPDSIIYSLIDEQTEPDTWFANDNYSFYYDGTGEFITQMDYVFLVTRDVLHRVTGVYDGQHRLTEAIEYSYYYRTLHPIMRTNFAYANDRIASIDYYYYPSLTGGEGYGRTTYEYDNQGRITIETRQFSPDSLSWQDESRTLFTYHPEDTSDGLSYIDYLRHDFIKSCYNYLDLNVGMAGMVSSMTSQMMYDNVWTDSYRYIYQYDDAHRLLSKTYQHMQNTWIDSSSENYTYNNNGNLVMLSSSYIDIDGYAHIGNMHLYTWEQFTGNEDETLAPAALKLSTYPNPFASGVNVNLESKSNAPVNMRVYNLKGQLIKALGKSKIQTWDGTDDNRHAVSSGIYFIRAEQDGHSVSSKVVKIKYNRLNYN